VTVRGSNRARTFGLLAMSLSTHVVVFTGLGLVPPPSRVLAMHESQFEVITPPPPPKVEAPPKPKDPDPPPPEPVKAAPHHAAPTPSAPPPPAASAPAPAEEVADLTGVTLTAEDGAGGWSTVVGSGGAMKGPAGKIGRPSVQASQQAAKVGPIGPRVVGLDSLSRKPEAPAGLDALLKRNYPRKAQLQGVEGEALVSLRIMPNGHIANLKVLREKPSGFDFGSACLETLRQAPPFVAPLDRSGTSVAVDIPSFRCSFEVAY
jgi:protein TonB